MSILYSRQWQYKLRHFFYEFTNIESSQSRVSLETSVTVQVENTSRHETGLTNPEVLLSHKDSCTGNWCNTAKKNYTQEMNYQGWKSSKSYDNIGSEHCTNVKLKICIYLKRTNCRSNATLLTLYSSRSVGHSVHFAFFKKIRFSKCHFFSSNCCDSCPTILFDFSPCNNH